MARPLDVNNVAKVKCFPALDNQAGWKNTVGAERNPLAATVERNRSK
jgi:hypothetical protein